MQAALFILDVSETSWWCFFKAFKNQIKKNKIRSTNTSPKWSQSLKVYEGTQKHKFITWLSFKGL